MQLELVGLEHLITDRDGAVAVGRPIAGLGPLDHLLDLGAEPRAEHSTIGLQPERTEVLDVSG